MPSLAKAYNWVIEKCNDSNVRYSRQYRAAQKNSAGYTCYDCSSLMWYAVEEGGWDTGLSYPFNTEGMMSILPKIGWTEMDATVDWKVGDILQKGYYSGGEWVHGHTEMVYKVASGSSGYTMGAHDNTGYYETYPEEQVSIKETKTSAASVGWTRLYRCPDEYNDIGSSGSSTQTSGVDVSKLSWWYSITADYPASKPYGSTNQDNNACKIAAYFLDKGLTYAAICGILGNMAHEAYMNPGQMEIGYGGSTLYGYGLIQWTPPPDYPDITLKNWAKQKGEKWYDGDFQLQTIWDECTNESEAYAFNLGPVWIKSPSHGYEYTWDEFCKLTDYKEALYAFLYERERGSWSDVRLEAATYYWNYFKTNKVNTSSTTTGTSNDSTNDGSGSSSANVGYVGQARKKLSLSTNKVMVLYNRRF